MIDAKELRIGNLLLRLGKMEIIGGIDDATEEYHESWLLYVKKDAHSYPIKEFMPIPLTPELLEACGFEKDGFNAYNFSISPWPETHLKQLSFTGDYLYLREGDLEKNRIQDSLCVLWNNDLRGKMNLHQLQNLFFDLTNTELEVNLKAAGRREGV